MELLSRYSNRENLLKPLVSLLQRIEDGDQTTEPGVQSAGPVGPWRVSDRLTEAYVAQLVAEFKQGTARHALATRYDISLSSVKRILRKHHQP